MSSPEIEAIAHNPVANHARLTHPKYRKDIDGLRAVAVMAVVVFHAFPSILRGGFVGVDIFFVISGFLISTIIIGSLEMNAFSFTEFYSRRVRRIFPALFVVLAATFSAGWFKLLAQDYTELGAQTAAGAGFVSNLFFWSEAGYFDTSAATKPLLHLWSLGIEEQFYLVWPLILWAASRRVNLLKVIALVGCVSFALNIHHVDGDPVGAFYSPQTRFWELLIGSGLAWIKLHRPQDSTIVVSNIQSLVGAMLLGIAVTMTTEAKPFPGWWALLPTLGAALLIAAGPRALLNCWLLSNRVMVWIGSISFPLYLWHWPLLAFARIIHGNDVSWHVRGGCVALAIALAWLTYRVIENPLRHGGNARIKIAILLCAVFTMGTAGYAAYASNGLQFRPIIQKQNKFIAALSGIASPYGYFQIFPAWRKGICHQYANGTTIDQLIATCADKERPLVFLMGDSYAAMLYPGLVDLQKNGAMKFGIAQFTNSNGPPFFDNSKRSGDWDSDNLTLTEINSMKVDAIKRLKPAVVLISWMYNGMNGITDKRALVKAISETVARIKEVSPSTRVLVLGPVPQWKGFLKDVIISYAHEHNGELPPPYTTYHLVEEPREFDQYLKDELPKVGIGYVSTQDALCDTRGCITRTHDDPRDVIAADWGHLTVPGSIYLIQRLKDRIFAEVRKAQ